MNVAYFAGCAANYTDPEVGKATLQVLRHNGFQVLFPDQKCCGLPPLTYGNLKTARRLAWFNVHSLVQAGCEVITACTTCALALKKEYPRLLGTDESEAVSRQTYDICEYLALLWSQGRLKMDFRPVSFSGLYHAPCHLKAVGEDLVEQRLKLMRMVPGAVVERVERGCCGMAGTFGSKRDNYALSLRIGESLFQAIKERAPDKTLTDCPTCIMQLAQGTGLPVSHPVLVFRQAYSL
jgi:Fe-S oxidoreductase